MGKSPSVVQASSIRHKAYTPELQASGTSCFMTVQSYRADRATAVSKLWSCLSVYLSHCATQATSITASAESDAQPEEQTTADDAQSNPAVVDNADASAADETSTAAIEKSADAENEAAAAAGDTCEDDAAVDAEATDAGAEADEADSNVDSSTAGTAEAEQAADAATVAAGTTQVSCFVASLCLILLCASVSHALCCTSLCKGSRHLSLSAVAFLRDCGSLRKSRSTAFPLAIDCTAPPAICPKQSMTNFTQAGHVFCFI